MLLYPLLQEYLIENGRLPLSATGLLEINQLPARLQEADKQLLAPVSPISLIIIASTEPEMQKLVSFLSARLSISSQQATDLLEKENVAEKLLEENGDATNWQYLGLFQHVDGSIQFTQSPSLSDYLPDLPIEKILRQPVSESVITQQAVTTDYEPELELAEPEQKDYWWAWAIAIFVISVLLILFR